MLLGQKRIKCFARPVYEPFLILLFVCILYKIKVYVSSSSPISKMKIMLLYRICFGHNNILFCFLGNMLIKLEVLKFKLFNCLEESCQGAIINKYLTRYIQQLYIPQCAIPHNFLLPCK